MRRSRGGEPDRFLGWKLGIFFFAAGVWVAGAATGSRTVTGAAIVILLGGLVLRVITSRRTVPEADEEEHYDEHDA